MRAYVLASALLIAGLTLPMGAMATGWTMAFVITDKVVYRPGSDVQITVTGLDSDSDPTDNLIDVTVSNPQGNVLRRWNGEDPGASGPWQKTYRLGMGAMEGSYTIRVYDAATGTEIGNGGFRVVRPAGKILKLDPGLYTGTDTYVPGETIHAHIVGAEPNGQYTVTVTFGPTTLRSDDISTDADGNADYDYTLASDAPDGPSPSGEGYAVSLTGPSSDTQGFKVKSYVMELGIERSTYMPDEVVTAHYRVTSIKDGSPAPAGLSGTWRLTDILAREMARGTFSVPLDTFEFSAPSQKGPYSLTAWYNTTDGKRFAEDSLTFSVSDMDASILSPRDGSSVQPGAGVVVDVYVHLGMGTPLPGADVSVTVTRSGSQVSEYSRSGMTTISDGHAGYAFMVSTTESDGTILKIEAKASKGSTSVTDSVEITVTRKATPGLVVNIESDRSEYFSGETATFTVTGSVEVSPESFTYHYTVGSGANVFHYSVSNTNSLTFQIPGDFEGVLTASVRVYDALGNSTAASINVDVRFAMLLVNANRLTYLPGDAVLVSYAFMPGGSLTPDFFYEITDASGVVVKSEPLTSTSFTFIVPKPASDSYTITVYASVGGHIVSDKVKITLLAGFAFRVSISTPQPYSTGYLPGQDIQIHYTIVKLGEDALPSHFQISYSTFGENDPREVLTSASEGELPYTIPGGTDDSVMLLLTATIDTRAISTVLMLPVDSSPSPLNYRVVGTLTIGDIILGLIIVMLIIAILVIKRSWIRERLFKRGGGPARAPSYAQPPVQQPQAPMGDPGAPGAPAQSPHSPPAQSPYSPPAQQGPGPL